MDDQATRLALRQVKEILRENLRTRDDAEEPTRPPPTSGTGSHPADGPLRPRQPAHPFTEDH